MIYGVEHDDVRGLGGAGVRGCHAVHDVGVKLWRGDGCYVGCVRCGNRNAVDRVHEVLNTVETFRGEFIVCERT